MEKPKLTILAISLITALSVIAASALASYIRVIHLSSAGTITTMGTEEYSVEVYSDVALTTMLTSVDWGLLDPGSTKSVDCYIKNSGSYPVTLTMTTTNWNPTNASNYMTFTWNREGYLLEEGSFAETTFTLTVSSTLAPETGIRTFSFDIIINAGGA